MRSCVLQSGDAGTMLNKAILTKDAPLADVLFGVDNTFLSRALEADIFETYKSPELEMYSRRISNSMKPIELTPVDFGDVCINYDKKYFSATIFCPVPQSWRIWQSLIIKICLWLKTPPHLPRPAFLLATRRHFGDGYLDYWQA